MPEVPSVGPLNARDARIIRTGDALCNALLRLLQHKSLDEITIREIASEADIHYTTFYRHYATKEALLDNVAAKQMDCLIQLALPVLEKADSKAAFVTLFSYVHDHRILWTALLTGGSAGVIREEFLRISRRLAADRPSRDGWLPVELAVGCTVSMLLEVLSWWLGRPQGSISVESAAELLHRLISSSTMRWRAAP